MPERILVVDDEQSLLNGIERRLGEEFDLVTALSGEAGLRAMEEQGPIAVVITDMRMPKMDGVQFIQAARFKWPDTVYIMLTGNRDQATAIQALNEGQVFRFFTKPCQGADLKKAIDSGLRQYHLLHAEKELLENTFVGAVSVLTDVLELMQPQIFSRVARIREIVRVMVEELGLEDRWEYKLSAQLGLLGFALLPEEERLVFQNGTQSSEAFDRCSAAASTIGKKLLERIPRMKTVAEIIGIQPEVDGSLIIPRAQSESEKTLMGAMLLRTAIYWDAILRQGMSPGDSVTEFRKFLPGLPTKVINILKELVIDDAGEGIKIDVRDLEEGMVLSDDLVTDSGKVLLRKGRRLTWTIIERLRIQLAEEDSAEPIRVRSSVSKQNVVTSTTLEVQIS
jgi:response regulator RpfG family c-di-GMP phosphodiesterase